MRTDVHTPVERPQTVDHALSSRVMLLFSGLLFSLGVQHVHLREQDDSPGDAVQPQGEKGGPVAHTGEKADQRTGQPSC